MRRKVLRDVVNTLCEIFAGYRRVPDDQRFLALGNGTLSVNLFTSEAIFNEVQLPSLQIANELSIFFLSRLEAFHIAKSDLKKAEVKVDCVVGLDKEFNRRFVDYHIASSIETDEVTYVAKTQSSSL